MQLVLRGNWLRAELATRIIAAAKRSLTLESLVAEVRGRLEAEPTVEDYEFLAAIHLAEGAVPEAVIVLSEAVGEFPDDLDLSAELRGSYRKAGNIEALSVEFQRILGYLAIDEIQNLFYPPVLFGREHPTAQLFREGRDRPRSLAPVKLEPHSSDDRRGWAMRCDSIVGDGGQGGQQLRQ